MRPYRSVSRISTEIIDDPDRLASLRSDWDQIAIEAARPMSMSPWLLGWWRARRCARLPADIRVIVGHANGRLAGLASFIVTRRRLGPTSYALPGAGSMPRIGPVCRPGGEADFGEAMARCLADRDGPHLLVFEDTDMTAPWPTAIAEHWSAGGRARMRWTIPQSVPTVELAGKTFSQWWNRRSGRLRADMRRGESKLLASGASMALAEDVAAFDRAVEGLGRLHAIRWPAARSAAAQDSGLLRHAGHELLPGGHIRLWTMEIGGAIIAANLMACAGGEVVGIASAFDARWKELQPGLHLQVEAIRHSFAVGDRRFDLGLGGAQWKLRLADGDRLVGSAVLVPPGLLGMPLQVWERLDGLALSIARSVPEGWRDRLRRAGRRGQDVRWH